MNFSLHRMVSRSPWRSAVSATRRCGGRSLRSSNKSSLSQPSALVAGHERQRLQPSSKKSAGTLPISPTESILEGRATTLELGNCRGQLLSGYGRFDCCDGGTQQRERRVGQDHRPGAGDARLYVTAARGAISPSRSWMTFGVVVVIRFHAALPLTSRAATV